MVDRQRTFLSIIENQLKYFFPLLLLQIKTYQTQWIIFNDIDLEFCNLHIDIGDTGTIGIGD